MFDIFRFLAASCSVLITVYLAYNLAWFVLLFPLGILFIPFRNKEHPIAVATFLGHLFEFYLMTSFMVLVRQSWLEEMPHLSVWTAVIIALVFIPWFFSVYVRKAEALELAYAAYRSASHKHDDESFKLGEQWMTFRVMVPWLLYAAIIGAVMVVVSLFAPGLFINRMTETILSWYDYVLAVPVLPLLLMLGGFLMAAGMIFKAMLFLFAAGSSVRHRSHIEDEDGEEAPPSAVDG